MISCYHCQVDGVEAATLTIDELAASAGTTTRRIRSFQTLGLLPHPVLRGRTGRYGAIHRARLEAILRLQDKGFSLESLVVLFDALGAGQSLAGVLGADGPAGAASRGADGPAGAASRGADGGTDSAELYGFAELQRAGVLPRRGRPLLSVVPTTVWDENQAS
jgi:DNA-binding transcriptional MerR regulator